LLAGVALAPARAEGPIQGGYSTKPLEAPVFETAQVAVEAAAFNNWLNENYSGLTPETMKGPREHLYYLIDSWVSSIYRRDGVVLPSEHDLVLQTFFSWAERLGVFGGHLIYNAIKSEEAPKMPPLMTVPDEFSLSLRRDMLHVESNKVGWSVSVPYYFMIWNISEFDATEGPRTQLLSLSTSAAAHQGLEGHSQATLMLLVGPGQKLSEFEEFYRTALGFTGTETPQALPVGQLTSKTKFDEATKLHSEYTSWQAKGGPMVVAYMGMNGTYQSNRANFIDFVRAVHSGAD